jgi:TRAP-type C4-dicarboxylate transport system permease small subunit
MESRLAKWARYLANLGALLLSVASLMAFVNVVTRKVFAHPFSWSDELVGFLGVWVVYLPLVMLEQSNSHLRVTVLYDYFSKKVKWWIDRLQEVLVVLLLGYFVYLGTGVVQMNAELHIVSPTLGLPLALLYAIVPVSFALGALAGLFNLATALACYREKGV